MRDRRRVLTIPVIAEPVVVPVPLLAVPVQVTDVQVAIGVAVMYRASSVTPLIVLQQTQDSELNSFRYV